MPANPNLKVVQDRRDYNAWVATETIEDYALRFAPKSFRNWSEFLVANTAIGGISAVALEAIGASIAISYGFTNSLWGILLASSIIFLTGLPITYYAAKFNIDMDLLTRGAGFGYIGSTITSLIYASFTFIFFALEAAIMAQALALYFHLPLAIGYVVCSLIIIPLVFFGITLINQLQLWTQPIWLVLMLLPFICILYKEPEALSNWVHFAGHSPSGTAFSPLLLGSAATVSFSLIAQIGEQVDFLRFLPDKEPANRGKWWFAVVAAGPGWILLAAVKQLAGAFLASLAVSHGTSLDRANEPTQMYLVGFEYVFSNPEVALAITILYVVLSQIKINVMNAYAGSLAWSNFFSRLTHSHPGRVVWLVFNVTIALLLMELDVFSTLEMVLGFYSNVAIAWVGAIVADLVINKPLGLSPSYIEFKRAHLYNVNPVGFGSMVIGSIVSIVAFVGAFGAIAQAYAPLIALGLAFVLAPIIAVLTKSKYYIARPNTHYQTGLLESVLRCRVCDGEYEPYDIAYCPVYEGAICSLCCSLDARCHDVCKEPDESRSHPLASFAQTVSTTIFRGNVSSDWVLRTIKYLSVFVSVTGLVGIIFSLIYYHQIAAPEPFSTASDHTLTTLTEVYAALLVLIAIGSWWLVLAQESRQLAQKELDKQNIQLQQEVKERQQAEAQLQAKAKQLEQTLHNLRQAEEQLIQTEKMAALGGLVAGIAHEINTPIGIGVTAASLLVEKTATFSENFSNGTMKRSDLARFLDTASQSSKMTLANLNRAAELIHSFKQIAVDQSSESRRVFKVKTYLEEILLQLSPKVKPLGHAFKLNGDPNLCWDSYPGVFSQIVTNLIMNSLIHAYDEGDRGLIILAFRQIDEQLVFEYVDDGKGILPEHLNKIFEPFFTTKRGQGGSGLGLHIVYNLVIQKLGGTIQCYSQVGVGTTFMLKIPMRL
ncbi:ATP-binding protein [Stenomitos frigidus]|uniref:histidine kinase n=1 Tax=Stenomitos frigidus ULC18 TaxID=2107698 RepID=A0A2T1E534_9CYAN|nr:ATP-binding protein [Stenomitos frigidus]PSB27815.1 histidine kinase [Stenomitos frigidus ULC18]